MESLDDMILLAEVAETGSFTRAGLRLEIPKSTISQRIAQLEERLGLRLLHRSTRHVTLTSSGQVYVEYCRRIRAEASAANMAMTNLKVQPVGPLKITCPEVTATYFMPEFLRGLTAEFPRIVVELVATNRILDIIRERVDFAFRVGEVTGQNLTVRRISWIRRVLVAAPSYLAASAPLTKPNDLLHHRCLLHDAQRDWQFASGDRLVSFRPPAACLSDSIGFLLQSSIAGNGIAMLPAYVCQTSIAAIRLVELLPGWKIPSHELTLISPKSKNRSSAQAAFRAYVNAFDFTRLSAGL
jgi:DNA-binding transcriptional LysR family regulator